MEMTLREILVIAGVVVVVGIFVFDGLRRVRNSRKNTLGIKLDVGGSVDGIDLFAGELPSGGARKADNAYGGSEKDHEALDEDVLLEEELSIEGYEALSADGYEEEVGPLTTAEAENEDPVTTFIDPTDATAGSPDAGEISGADKADADSAATKKREPVYPSGEKPKPLGPARVVEQRVEPSMTFDTIDHMEDSDALEGIDALGDVDAIESVDALEEDWEATAPVEKPPTEVLVINVMAKKGGAFSGRELVHAMLSCGLHHGEMNVFHRYVEANGEGGHLFIVANAVEPGTFSLENIDAFSTRGICMFLSLPGPKSSLKAFNVMVESARTCARMLNGEMLDENRSVMTQQTVEHYRQRVLEFERKLMSRKALETA